MSKALTGAARKLAAARKLKAKNKREWARVIKAAEAVLRSAGIKT